MSDNPYTYKREPGWDYCYLQGRTEQDGFSQVTVYYQHGVEREPFHVDRYDYLSFVDTEALISTLTADGWKRVAAIVGLGERDELYRIYRRTPRRSA